MKGGPNKKVLIPLSEALRLDDFISLQSYVGQIKLKAQEVRDIFFAAAKYTSALEEPRRYHIIVEILLQYREMISREDIVKGYKLAASGGNITILELFNRRFYRYLKAKDWGEAFVVAAAKYELKTVEFFLKEPSRLLIDSLERVMLILAAQCKLSDGRKRLELIQSILLYPVSAQSIIEAYYAAAKAGNLEIFKYLESCYCERIKDNDINKAFFNAVSAKEFAVAYEMLMKHGQRITSANKENLLLVLSSTMKIIDPELRLQILTQLLMHYREEISDPILINSFKAAALAGDMKVLEKLNEYCQDKLTDEDLNDIFVAKPKLHYDKYWFLLKNYGRKLSPHSKGTALVDIASHSKYLDSEIRFEAIMILLRDFREEIPAENKKVALEAAQKQADTNVLDLFQAYSRATFPNPNILERLMDSLTEKFSKAEVVDHAQEALKNGITASVSFSDPAESNISDHSVESSSSSSVSPLCLPDGMKNSL